VKKSNIDTTAVKELMYGGIKQLMSHREYYYNSTIGSEYSHFTDKGKEALAEFVNMIGHKMFEAEQQELDNRAKQLVINGLKGETI
jgi:hypothetical protein